MNENILLRHPDPSEWDILRRLWCAAFPDDANGFCNFFLSRRTDPAMALVAERNGRIESAFYFLECRHLYHGEPCGEYIYVYGGGTWPDARGHRYMQKLMYRTVEISAERGLSGMCFTSAPELEEAYDRYGFQRGADLFETEVDLSGSVPLSCEWQDCDYGTYTALRHAYLCSLPSAIEWLGDTDRLFFDDAQNCGRVLKTTINGKWAYAVCMEDDGGWILRETDLPLSEGLYSSLAEFLGCEGSFIVQSRDALGENSTSDCFCHYGTQRPVEPSLSNVYLNLIPD